MSVQLAAAIPPGCELVISGGFTDPKAIVTSASDHDVSCLSSTQEETDTRVVLHAKEASLSGYEQIITVARHTDILLLLLAFQEEISAAEIWMKSGTSQKPKFVAVHQINIPVQIRKSILQFHALTGSDTTSQFANIGKKKTAWKVFCQESNAGLLEDLGAEPLISTEVRDKAEEFVCKLYQMTTKTRTIQALRSKMFRSSKKSLENMPPNTGSTSVAHSPSTLSIICVAQCFGA